MGGEGRGEAEIRREAGMGRRERERGVTRRGEELGPRDQLPLNQLPIDQLPTGSTPIKSTSHEINCNIIRGILKFHPRGK